jgi:putative membrane protein
MPVSKSIIPERYVVPVVGTLSAAIPLVVALLLFMPKTTGSPGFDVYLLPKINAFINSTVTILLFLGYLFIRRRMIRWHKAAMLGAFILSSLFLVSYVVYHFFAESTKFGGEGWMRGVYFFVLFSHILLAAVIVPLALFSIVHALSEKYDKHRKIAKITLPIWLYVSTTGVLVYILISPYYPQ